MTAAIGGSSPQGSPAGGSPGRGSPGNGETRSAPALTCKVAELCNKEASQDVVCPM